jgi:hypothetical protein
LGFHPFPSIWFRFPILFNISLLSNFTGIFLCGRPLSAMAGRTCVSANAMHIFSSSNPKLKQQNSGSNEEDEDIGKNKEAHALWARRTEGGWNGPNGLGEV